MPLGLGRLQRAILINLQNRHANLPIILNRLLWEIAFDRDEIRRTGHQYRSKEAIIEEGTIKKSFDINFRRAIKNLEVKQIITIKKEKVTDLDSVLLHLPYITSKLEVFQIRTVLLPTIMKYITKNNPMIRHKDFDPFYYQIQTLREERILEYKTLQSEWDKIERNIVKLLANVDFKRFDQWLDALLWGRYYFRGRKERIISNPPLSTKTPEEASLVKKINTLSQKIKLLNDFKIGDTKKVLYAIFNVPRYRETSLSYELKHYLFEEKKGLLRSLPGDEDAQKFAPSHFTKSEYNLINRKYSPLLNDLFTRHIFRKLSFIELPT
ncbi:MAG: hypothetical protein IEMM0002_0342 [bacterium]|nr:MAG: hypothetical protein IEMM0002_0342 [bacterium]